MRMEDGEPGTRGCSITDEAVLVAVVLTPLWGGAELGGPPMGRGMPIPPVHEDPNCS